MRTTTSRTETRWRAHRCGSTGALRAQSGFTLLELMVALAVLAILLGVGIPSFNGTIRNNQIAAQSSNLVTALALARAEAMKRGMRVSVCAAADSDTCTNGTDWSGGWIVFADDFGTAGVIDESDVPLQNWGPAPDGVRIAASAPSVSFSHRARAASPLQLTVTKPGCTVNQARRIDVANSGRIGLTRRDCSSTATNS